ncbi:MAG: hypothetical protein NVS4B3_04550 [Gemmatimonadaceae bacterium]
MIPDWHVPTTAGGAPLRILVNHAETDVSHSPDPTGTLAASLAELEARIAAAERAGETVPAEAHTMLARLREISVALDGLMASLRESGSPDGFGK